MRVRYDGGRQRLVNITEHLWVRARITADADGGKGRRRGAKEPLVALLDLNQVVPHLVERDVASCNYTNVVHRVMQSVHMVAAQATADNSAELLSLLL